MRGRVGFVGSQHSRGEGEAAHQEYGGAGEVGGPHVGGGGGGDRGGGTGPQQRGGLSVGGHVCLLLSPPTNQYVICDAKQYFLKEILFIKMMVE